MKNSEIKFSEKYEILVILNRNNTSIKRITETLLKSEYCKNSKNVKVDFVHNYTCPKFAVANTYDTVIVIPEIPKKGNGKKNRENIEDQVNFLKTIKHLIQSKNNESGKPKYYTTYEPKNGKMGKEAAILESENDFISFMAFKELVDLLFKKVKIVGNMRDLLFEKFLKILEEEKTLNT